MKLFSVTSPQRPNVYVFAENLKDAKCIHTAFKALVDLSHHTFQIMRVDHLGGYKQDRPLQRILKSGVRGVGAPHPYNPPYPIDISVWHIWTVLEDTPSA
ncbi:MAG: hypothetical protein ABI668_13395 [Sphingorhabdus sp.]